MIMATIIINKDRCKACGFCIAFCPKQLLQMSDDLNLRGIHYACIKNESGLATAEPEIQNPKSKMPTCTGCAICALVCPEVAIEVVK
jgi:2-oxoglutarate ferredoxin oxidoreductase subunit delta